MKGILMTGMLFLSFLIGCDYQKNEKVSPEKSLNPEKKLELAEKCSKAGKAFFTEYISTKLPEGFLWDEPEYHYSSKLNTCLIHIRYVSLSPKHSIHRNQVIDIFANKHILYGWFNRDTEKQIETLSDSMNGDSPNYTSNEYFIQKDKLFKE